MTLVHLRSESEVVMTPFLRQACVRPLQTDINMLAREIRWKFHGYQEARRLMRCVGIRWPGFGWRPEDAKFLEVDHGLEWTVKVIAQLMFSWISPSAFRPHRLPQPRRPTTT